MCKHYTRLHRKEEKTMRVTEIHFFLLKGTFRTFALTVSVHPYCAREFTRRVMSVDAE